MKHVFVDSGAFFGMFVPEDAHHQRATEFSARQNYGVSTMALVRAPWVLGMSPWVNGGDPSAAERRLLALTNIPILTITGEVGDLAGRFVDAGALPRKAFVDAVHVAAAAIHGMDFLLTWNCTHIANANIRARLEPLCRSRDLQPPMICTPEELLA